MWTREFWLDVLERLIRTAAQTAAGSIATTALIQDVNWAVVGGATGIATLLAFLMALGAPKKNETGTASYVVPPETKLP